MPGLRRAQNAKGFSLIELLIAIIIIMISMLALLNSIVVSTRTNVENDVRNAAIRLANQTAETLLALPLDDDVFSPGPHVRTYGDATLNSKGFPIPRRTIRNFQQDFDISWEVPPQLSAELRRVQITVTYQFRGKSLSQQVAIYRHKTI